MPASEDPESRCKITCDLCRKNMCAMLPEGHEGFHVCRDCFHKYVQDDQLYRKLMRKPDVFDPIGYARVFENAKYLYEHDRATTRQAEQAASSGIRSASKAVAKAIGAVGAAGKAAIR